MQDWPAIADRALLERLGLSDDEFAAFIARVVGAVPAREFTDAIYDRALGYPWKRPEHSYVLRGETVEAIDEVPALGEEPRFPLLAFGSNGAPETLIRKLGGLPPDEQDIAVVTGRLHGFDVGPAALPTFYGSLAATIFESPGTAVRAAIVWATATQLTTIVSTEISYFFGRLDDIRFVPDDAGGEIIDSVFAFASRWGVQCVDGEPVALAAVPADGRRVVECTQEQLLDRVASLVMDDGSKARDLVRRITEDFAGFAPSAAPGLGELAQQFASDKWTRFPS